MLLDVSIPRSASRSRCMQGSEHTPVFRSEPHSLSWKVPAYVVRKVSDALNDESKALRGSKVLLLGVAYKRDIDDLRESPALEVIRLLQEKGAEVSYHDPHCPTIADDGHTPLKNLPLHSQPLTEEVLVGTDAVVLVTDHSAVDYQQVVDHARVVVDTRGSLRALPGEARVVPLAGQALGALVPTPPAPPAADEPAPTVRS